MKDSEHPILALLGLAGFLFLSACGIAVFLGAGYIWVKMCLPIVIFLGAMLLGLAGIGPPR
jgi:hypothetical protein